MIARRIHQTFELGEHPFDLTWQSLGFIDRFNPSPARLSTHFPSQRQPTDGDVTQSHDDGEKGVQITKLLATEQQRSVSQ